MSSLARLEEEAASGGSVKMPESQAHPACPNACASQVLLSQIIRQEPLISENRRPALRQLVERLLQKMQETQHHSFTLFKVRAAPMRPCWGSSEETACMRGRTEGREGCHAGTWGPPCMGTWPISAASPLLALGAQVLRAHILPLTNCAFNKAGDRFITGSYDRTCKVRTPSIIHPPHLDSPPPLT
jgi:hypothetical protein